MAIPLWADSGRHEVSWERAVVAGLFVARLRPMHGPTPIRVAVHGGAARQENFIRHRWHLD